MLSKTVFNLISLKLLDTVKKKTNAIFLHFYDVHPSTLKITLTSPLTYFLFKILVRLRMSCVSRNAYRVEYFKFSTVQFCHSPYS